MAVITIKVPQPKDDSMGASFTVLLKTLEKTNTVTSGDELCFDLSKLDFVFPFLILPLSALINQFRNKSIMVNIVHGSCTSYLSTICFPDGVSPLSTSSWETVLNSYSVKSYLPVCAIPAREHMSTQREQLITIFEQILVNQLKINGQLKISLSYLLGEAITNIVDHAQVENGFIMVQNYPSKDFLDVCIVDTGVGILKTYNPQRFPDIKTDEQAMTYAVTGKSTKNQAVTRGYGISTSRNMLVKGMLGKYFLFSGEAFYYYSNENEIINVVDSRLKWSGTMLALRIPKMIPEKFNYINFLE